MNHKNSSGTFPAPYINDVKEDDSIMIRVNQDKLEIASRSSGLPKDIASSGMNLDHVGSGATK